MSNSPAQHLSVAADTISAAAIVGTLMGWLPDLAALAGLAWYLLQMYESKTFQGWLTARRHKKRHRRHKPG